MKKEAELTPQEKQEKAWTQKRIHYHNVQAKGVTVWKEQAQDVLEQKMDEAKLIQIFEPLHLNEAAAFEILFEQAKLNKILLLKALPRPTADRLNFFEKTYKRFSQIYPIITKNQCTWSKSVLLSM